MHLSQKRVTLLKSTLALALAVAASVLAPGGRAARVAQRGAFEPADKVSPDLRDKARAARAAGGPLPVIVQLEDAPSGRLNALLNRNGVHVRAHFEQLAAYSVELPPAAVEELADFPEVGSVTYDREVSSFGHVSATTGAEAANSLYQLDASGVVVAVLDSGVDTTHKAFLSKTCGTNSQRVKYSKDFTGEGTTGDPYGHGTHVSALAMGTGCINGGANTGVAANASIVNLRVLNGEGRGTTSAVLAAVNWLLANPNYNVRVANLSLGAVATTSYRQDPLCLAVRKLVNSGVVVVAAAGNDGKDAQGNKVYGTIHAPGNEPAAITVGATNTFGTDYRGDDTVATYSSRGPTRSFWTDAAGARHYDNLVKPDLVAPGNKLVSAQSGSLGGTNNLVKNFAHLQAKTTAPKEMYLSGTSMSAPVVAAAAAMLIRANNSLTPSLVKAILMYTAQPLAGHNAFEQGAGQLNVLGAVQFAQKVRTNFAIQPLGASLQPVTSPATLPPAPQTTIAGHTFRWSQGVILNHTFATGTDLLTKVQKVYGQGILLSDGVVEGPDSQSRQTTMLTNGILLADSILTSDGSPLGGGSPILSSGFLLGDGILLSDGILLADGHLLGDAILFGDGHLAGDHELVVSLTLINGDNTSYMK